MRNKNNILIIGDVQRPFGHPDYLAFCEAVAEKHDCGRIVDIGDAVDCLNWSDHPHNPDAPSATEELDATRQSFDLWGAVFPKVEVVTGNHERRVRRRLDKAGFGEAVLPMETILREVFGMPKKWSLHENLLIDTPKGRVCLMHGDERGASVRPGATSNIVGMSLCRGHSHSAFYLHYVLTHTDLRFDMLVGCGIDPSSVAFNYNKKDLKRPILGCGVIKNGVPKLVPMDLKVDGRWSGKLT